MGRIFFTRTSAVLLPILLGACGLQAPEMEEFYQKQQDEALYENTIVTNIKCELEKGIWDETHFQNGGERNDTSWIKSWGALVNLKLSADEKSQLNPGGSISDIFQNSVKTFPKNGNVTSGQSFSAGFGLSSSADATRIETIAFTYDFKTLLADYARKPVPSCAETEKGITINSDLKIGQFIHDKVVIASIPGSVYTNNKSGEPKTKPGGPYSVFSYQMTFVVGYGGNLTPTWKFAEASANPSSPFFMSSRQKTNDLTITLGPAKPATKTTPADVSGEAHDIQFAHLIGQAVATAIQSQQH